MFFKLFSNTLCLYALFLGKILGQGIALTFNLLLLEIVCSMVYIIKFIQSHQIVAAHPDDHLILLYCL